MREFFFKNSLSCSVFDDLRYFNASKEVTNVFLDDSSIRVKEQFTAYSENYFNVGNAILNGNDLKLCNLNFFITKSTSTNSGTIDFIENSRFIKRTQGLFVPLRFSKLLQSDNSIADLFSVYFGEGSSEIKHKLKPYTTYLTFKQKRYKRKKFINFSSKNVALDSKLLNVK
jgi:hypothetical protein